MNLDELRSVQNKERQKDSLQHLRESFYEDVAAYITGLEAERDSAAEAAEDPFSSPQVRRLSDEIQTAKEVTQAVYERRLGKLVKRASLAAANMPTDDEGLTTEEQQLFSDLVDRIEQNKSHVLDVVEGETTPAGVQKDSSDAADSALEEPVAGVTAVDPAADPTAVDPGESPLDEAPHDELQSSESSFETDRNAVASDEASHVVGSDDPGSDSSATASDASPDGLSDRATVRITRNVGEIFGVDEREYNLTPETVVTLPEANADPLLERGAAERVD